MQFKGDVQITRTSTAQRHDSALNAETITAQKSLARHDAQWQRLSAASGQDCVLPDATTLPPGWRVVVDASGAATVTVKTYHATTPVTLQAVLSGRAYEFTCTNISSAAGGWHVNFLESADQIPSDRYSTTFNATTDWGSASGGYYTITVLASAHGRGTQPVPNLFELIGSDYIHVDADQVKVNGTTGDISIRVSQTPDGRFFGRLVAV
jgi:hypothetical protein